MKPDYDKDGLAVAMLNLDVNDINKDLGKLFDGLFTVDLNGDLPDDEKSRSINVLNERITALQARIKPNLPEMHSPADYYQVPFVKLAKTLDRISDTFAQPNNVSFEDVRFERLTVQDSAIKPIVRRNLELLIDKGYREQATNLIEIIRGSQSAPVSNWRKTIEEARAVLKVKRSHDPLSNSYAIGLSRSFDRVETMLKFMESDDPKAAKAAKVFAKPVSDNILEVNRYVSQRQDDFDQIKSGAEKENTSPYGVIPVTELYAAEREFKEQKAQTFLIGAHAAMEITLTKIEKRSTDYATYAGDLPVVVDALQEYKKELQTLASEGRSNEVLEAASQKIDGHLKIVSNLQKLGAAAAVGNKDEALKTYREIINLPPSSHRDAAIRIHRAVGHENALGIQEKQKFVPVRPTRVLQSHEKHPMTNAQKYATLYDQQMKLTMIPKPSPAQSAKPEVRGPLLDLTSTKIPTHVATQSNPPPQSVNANGSNMDNVILKLDQEYQSFLEHADATKPRALYQLVHQKIDSLKQQKSADKDPENNKVYYAALKRMQLAKKILKTKFKKDPAMTTALVEAEVIDYVKENCTIEPILKQDEASKYGIKISNITPILNQDKSVQAGERQRIESIIKTENFSSKDNMTVYVDQKRAFAKGFVADVKETINKVLPKMKMKIIPAPITTNSLQLPANSTAMGRGLGKRKERPSEEATYDVSDPTKPEIKR